MVIYIFPFRYLLTVDVDTEEIRFAATDGVIPIKVKIDRDPGFNDPVDLIMGIKHRLFTLEPVSLLPTEKEKIIYLKINAQDFERFKNRKTPPFWQMNIVGTVKGEITKQGKRTFQNAKYREMTPYFILELRK